MKICQTKHGQESTLYLSVRREIGVFEEPSPSALQRHQFYVEPICVKSIRGHVLI